MDAPVVPARGRPRSDAADRAIHEATLALLAELPRGYLDLTLQAVAERAGVGRPTVYRRHATKAELTTAALAHRFGLDPAPDTGTLRGDLLAVQHSQVAFFNDPAVAGAFTGLLADVGSDPETARRFAEGFVAPRRASAHRALERAVERGELPDGHDPEWVCDLLAGPLLAAATLRGRRRLPATIAQESTDAVLAALGVRA